MSYLRSVFGAAGWLALFLSSSIIICTLVVVGGVYTDNRFVLIGLYAYYRCMEDFQNGVGIDNIANSDYISDASDFTIIVTFMTYIPLLIIIFVKQLKGNEYKGLRLDTALFCIAIAATANIFVESLSFFASSILPIGGSEAEDTVKLYSLLSLSGQPIITFLVVGIVAPVIEEVVFRKGVQGWLQKINPTMAIIVTSVMFGVMHGNLIQGIFACVIGFILSYVYYKTNNLAYSIFMHMTINITGCVVSITPIPELPFMFGLSLLAIASFFISSKADIREFKQFNNMFLTKSESKENVDIDVVSEGE